MSFHLVGGWTDMFRILGAARSARGGTRWGSASLSRGWWGVRSRGGGSSSRGGRACADRSKRVWKGPTC